MVVLVTGCRSGFGLGMATKLAKDGHRVYAGVRSLETCPELHEALDGLNAEIVTLDVTSEADRARVMTQILEKEGRIDGLVNNAGVALGGFLEEVGEDELRHVFDVNVFAAWALTKLALPSMRENGGGKVVFMSSISGLFALPGLGVYASSKFALEGMVEAWRHELTPFGVDVYLVEPGTYKTDIWGRNRTMSRNMDFDGPYGELGKTLEERVVGNALNNLRDPQEVIDRTCALVTGRRTRLRHPMGPGVRQRMLARWLPASWLERAIQRTLFDR